MRSSRRMMRKSGILLATTCVLAACSDGPLDPGAQPTPTPGATSFHSADGSPGQRTAREAGGDATLAGSVPTDDAANGTSEARTVEEGDIYRVGPNGLILNLNAYRGLQIIDFSNPADPEIIGRVRVSGAPVEMYQVGDRVYMLINNWYGYYGNRESLRAQAYQGGLVLVADVSDPRAPRITGRAQVPGNIVSSRLTRGNGQEALFVAATDYDSTYVKSFSVSSAGALAAQTELELGGYVTAIQASADYLMVASFDWSQRGAGSDVSLIDISDPSGAMVFGDTVTVAGMVQNKHNMNVHGSVMRIVSGNNWSSSTNTNHVQTFDIANPNQVVPVGHETFGAGESLFATLFLGNKAFFVTYERVDPFHAFEISDAGWITERSEFIVSGWNDFFRPVMTETRLVGIGKNDENGTTLAVSLYDITDLDNPRPLLDRDEIDLTWSWSEANWDDRAFSVLEDATSVESEDGFIETGLVLLPFNGWDRDSNRSASGVQIFTFSNATITRRGVMEHDTPVRRTFMADSDENLAGNLSEAELSFFDATDPDAPQEIGRVELAPNYSGFLVFSDYGVRRSDDSAYWGWWRGGQIDADAKDRLEVVSLAGDVDIADAIATVEIPAGARVLKISGDRVAVVATEYSDTTRAAPQVTTTVELISFADPTNPRRLGSFETDDLPPTDGGYYPAYGDVGCFNCGRYYGGTSNLYVAGEALVVAQPISESAVEGQEHVEYRYPTQQRWENCWDGNGPRACTYVSGGVQCTQLTRVDGTEEPQVCYGEFFRCTQDDEGQTDCVEVDERDITVETNTSTHERRRYWYHYDLHVLDVSADAPTVGPVVRMARTEEAVDVLAVDDSLYVTHKRPHRVEGDARPYVRYFFREIGLANAQRPNVSADVNIPGTLVSVDGNKLVTRDHLWGRRVVETSVNRLTRMGSVASLDGTRRFADRHVERIELDGRGHVLVSHGPTWSYGRSISSEQVVRLAALDLESARFNLLSEVDIDAWASLRAAWNGRALFAVPGGMLVVNLDRIERPAAQAYFPVIGWPSDIAVAGDDVYLSAGRFGVYTLDANTANLLER